jgi:hypothetical protein
MLALSRISLQNHLELWSVGGFQKRYKQDLSTDILIDLNQNNIKMRDSELIELTEINLGRLGAIAYVLLYGNVDLAFIVWICTK